MPIVKCGVCSKDFYTKPNYQKRGWGKFCSTICRSKAQCKGKIVKCYICDENIYRSPKSLSRSKSSRFFCSKSCQTRWRNSEYIGEKSKNWRNGVSAYRDILRRKGEPEICMLCMISDKRVLAVHHIDHDRTNNKVGNLIWLCLNCHFLVHHDNSLDRKVRSKDKNGGVCRTV